MRIARCLLAAACLAWAAGCTAASSETLSEARTTAASRSQGPAAGVAAMEGAPRMIARTARLRIFHDEPEKAVQGAVDLARGYKGWAERQSRTEAVLRVPDGRLDEFLLALAQFGEVDEREISGVDVTERYFDAKLRLENLERIRGRYAALLDRARNVEEALPVERELERVVLRIEELKGKLAYLERSVNLATVRVRFRSETTPGPVGWIFYGLYHVIKWLFVWD